jgi:1-acyl-sn-glycerol-3-phosphate acyltransferase
MDGSFWLIAFLLVVLAGVIWKLKQIGGRHGKADWGGPFLNNLDGLMRVFCVRFHRMKHEPLPVPQAGGAIVAANHLSGLDPILLSAASRRPLRFVIATEQYKRPVLRWFYDLIGCIPVNRTGSPDRAFYSARRALAEGEIVVLFPQGSIRMPGAARKPLKRGVIALAAMARVPIIPVRISGVAGAGRIVSALFIRSRARIHAGAPLDVSDGRDEQTLLAIEEFITRGVYQDYREYFDADGKLRNRARNRG